MLKREALQILNEKIRTCTKCPELSSYRQTNNYHVVLSKGNPNADIVLIGEAPGQDEAQLGVPFVGKAGKLLDEIISYHGLDGQVYICNTICCRPPGNRNPTTEEARNCRGILNVQLNIVRPQFIVSLGKVAFQSLLHIGPDFSVNSKRHLLNLYVGTEFTAKVIATYHPAYILRNPSARRFIDEDFDFLKEISTP